MALTLENAWYSVEKEEQMNTQPIINALNLCYIHNGILLYCQLLLCICFCYYTKFSDLKAHIYFF